MPGQMVSWWSYNLIYHCVPLQLDDATDTWLELNSPILISRNYQRVSRNAMEKLYYSNNEDVPKWGVEGVGGTPQGCILGPFPSV